MRGKEEWLVGAESVRGIPEGVEKQLEEVEVCAQ